MTKEWISISADDAKAHELYGVGGWLLVFSIGLALSLLKEVGSINSEAMKAGLKMGELLAISHPAVSFIKMALAVDVMVVSVIYWMMFTKASSFRKVSCWLLLGSFPFIALLGTIEHFDGLGKAIGQAFFPWAISCAVWVSYLNKSRRVRITFECMDRVVSDKTDIAQASVSEAPRNHEPVKVAFVEESFDEVYWAKALAEFESSERRTGLWARSFAQAKGDEVQAKVAYLSARVRELAEEQSMKTAFDEQLIRSKQETERLASLSEEDRAYELLPKGKCPNCSTVQPLTSKQCPSCGAIFEGAAWNLIPLVK